MTLLSHLVLGIRATPSRQTPMHLVAIALMGQHQPPDSRASLWEANETEDTSASGNAVIPSVSG